MGDDGDAWERTLSEMDALAEELRAEGWTVRSAPAGATGVETRADRDTDRFGAVLVVPGDDAAAAEDAAERAAFPRCEVYARTAGDRHFTVLRFDAPENETCLLFAASFAVEDLRRLLPDVRDAGVVHVHIRSLDGSDAASFEISDPGLLVPGI